MKKHQTFAIRVITKKTGILKTIILTWLLSCSLAFASHEEHETHDPALLIVQKNSLSMLCFPPNNPQNTPPCPVPIGLDPALIAPAPEGKLDIKIFEDDTAVFKMKLKGLQKGMVVTSWFVHFPPNQPPPHPIFAPVGPGLPAVAIADSPMTASTARFSEGLSKEPNQLHINKNGFAHLKVKLDYNPLKSNQVPLVNGMRIVNQKLAPAGSIAEQGNCCADFPKGPRIEPIGGSYLRQFDPVTGFQLKDETGRPLLVRSPRRPVAVAVFVHIDGVTSGLVPGVPTPPFLVNPPSTTGSFYLLGLFPLGNIGMD